MGAAFRNSGCATGGDREFRVCSRWRAPIAVLPLRLSWRLLASGRSPTWQALRPLPLQRQSGRLRGRSVAPPFVRYQQRDRRRDGCCSDACNLQTPGKHRAPRGRPWSARWRRRRLPRKPRAVTRRSRGAQCSGSRCSADDPLGSRGGGSGERAVRGVRPCHRGRACSARRSPASRTSWSRAAPAGCPR
jgi:hypothetical protein